MGGRGVLQGYLVQKAKVLRLVGQVGLDLRRRVIGGREVDGCFVCVGHYGISLVFVKDAILNVCVLSIGLGIDRVQEWGWCMLVLVLVWARDIKSMDFFYQRRSPNPA